jgi:hypothetical protein
VRRPRSIAVVAALAAVVGGGAGVAWAATLNVTSEHLGAAPLTTPVFFPQSVVIANKTGQIAGKPEVGDVITIVYPGLIDEPTVCPAWSNATATQSINLTWAITAGTGGGNDTLATVGNAPGPCNTGSARVHVGTFDLGGTGRVVGGTGPLQFPNSTTKLAISGGVSTFTITLGTVTSGGGAPTAGTVTNSGRAIYTPDPVLKDQAGHLVTPNLAATAATTQF